MRVLLDTNIVIRNFNRDDAAHRSVADCLSKIVDARQELCLAPQVLYELWVVATRPVESNGLGLEPETAHDLVQAAIGSFAVLPDPEHLLLHWLHLCRQHKLRGKRAHDGRLIAWMGAHGIRDVVTLNSSHFSGFDDITTIIPGRPASETR